MAEEAPATPSLEAADHPAVQPVDVLIAGKYKDVGGLADGLREIQGKLGIEQISEGAALIGEKGVYSNLQAAETEYKRFESLLGKMTTPPATPDTVPPATNPNDPRPRDESGRFAPVEATEDKPLGLSEAPAGPVGAADIIAMAGLDNTALLESLNNGGLTEEQYAAFGNVKIGDRPISRDMVDNFIQGQASTQRNAEQMRQDARTTAHEIAGGEQQFGNLISFKDTLPEAQRAAMNEQLENPATYQTAIYALMHLQQKAVGAAGSKPLITGASPPATAAAQGFRTSDQVTAAMAESRAKYGSSYLSVDKELQAKLTATDKAVLRNQ